MFVLSKKRLNVLILSILIGRESSRDASKSRKWVGRREKQKQRQTHTHTNTVESS